MDLAKVKIQGTRPSCLVKTMGILSVGLASFDCSPSRIFSQVLCYANDFGCMCVCVCVEKCPLKHLRKLNHIVHFRLKYLISLSFLFSFLLTDEYPFCYLTVSFFICKLPTSSLQAFELICFVYYLHAIPCILLKHRQLN